MIAKIFQSSDLWYDKVYLILKFLVLLKCNRKDIRVFLISYNAMSITWPYRLHRLHVKKIVYMKSEMEKLHNPIFDETLSLNFIT